VLRTRFDGSSLSLCSKLSLLSASLANVVRCHDVRVREVCKPVFQYFLLRRYPYGDPATAIDKIPEPLIHSKTFRLGPEGSTGRVALVLAGTVRAYIPDANAKGISKSWKALHNLVIEVLPWQGLITGYNPVITRCPLPVFQKW